jgi:hypothetical protein
MNENNKSFYPSDMFEFIHHLEYGCHNLKGLNIVAFEGRERCFFAPCPARSTNFYSRWCSKLELHKVEVFENDNVWNVSLLWKKS